jgi:hypothetical protein
VPVLSLALLLAALVLCVVGWVLTRSARRQRASGEALLHDARDARATVVEVRERYRPRPDSDSMPTYFPVVSFPLPDGRLVEAEVLVGARPSPARKGSSVEVRYDPADPRRVVLAHGLATFGAASCFATGLGLVFWAAGGAVLLLWVLLVLVLRLPA